MSEPIKIKLKQTIAASLNTEESNSVNSTEVEPSEKKENTKPQLTDSPSTGGSKLNLSAMKNQDIKTEEKAEDATSKEIKKQKISIPQVKIGEEQESVKAEKQEDDSKEKEITPMKIKLDSNEGEKKKQEKVETQTHKDEKEEDIKPAPEKEKGKPTLTIDEKKPITLPKSTSIKSTEEKDEANDIDKDIKKPAAQVKIEEKKEKEKEASSEVAKKQEKPKQTQEETSIPSDKERGLEKSTGPKMFGNYESVFQKQSENIIDKIRTMKAAPKTRFGMLLLLIGISVGTIGALMVLTPEKHSFSRYKANILDLYTINKYNINETVETTTSLIEEKRKADEQAAAIAAIEEEANSQEAKLEALKQNFPAPQTTKETLKETEEEVVETEEDISKQQKVRDYLLNKNK